MRVHYVLVFVLLGRHGYKNTAPNTLGSLFPRRKIGIQAQKFCKKPQYCGGQDRIPASENLQNREEKIEFRLKPQNVELCYIKEQKGQK